MKQFFEKQWKRVVSVVLALVLVFGTVGVMPGEKEVEAAGTYQTVKFGATSYSANHTSNYWDLNLNLSEAIAIPTDWAWNADGWTVPVTIGEITINASVNYNGQYLLSFFINGIEAPLDGTTMIIQKGSYDSAGDEYGITILNDYECVWDATNARWNITMLTSYQELIFNEVLGATYNTSAGWWEMTFGLTTPFQDPTTEWGPAFVNVPITIDSTAIGNAQITMTNNTYQVTLFFSTSLDAPVGGEKLTIKKGQYQTSDGLYGITVAKDYLYQFSAETGSWIPYVEQTIAEMSIDSVLNFTAGADWRFNLNMLGTWPTNGSLDTYTAKDFTITMKNKAGEVLAGGADYHKNGNYMLLVIWGEHTANNAPVEGDTITLSSGKLAYSGDENILISFAEETVLIYDGSAWSIYVEQTIAEMSIDSVLNFTAGADWRLNLNMLGTWPTNGSLDTYTAKDFTITMKNKAGEVLAGGADYHKNENYMLLVIWGEHTANNAPAEGDTITLSSGKLAYSGDENILISFAEETVLIYNGSEWTIYVETQYQNITICDFVASGGYASEYWDMRFDLETAIVDPTSGDWGPQFTIPVYAGDNELSAIITIPGNGYSISTFISTTIGTPTDGCVFRIDAGSYKSSDELYGITITEDFLFEYHADEDAWERIYDIEYQNVDITDIYVPGSAYQSTYWDLYCDLLESVVDPTSEWGPQFTVPVTIGGTEYTSTITITGTQAQVSLFISTTVGTPANGTTMTICEGKYENADKAYGIDILQDYTFRWNGTVWVGILQDTGVQHDVNSDEIVSASDLVRIKRKLNNSETAINEAEQDVNYSGAFDVVDASSMRKILIGMIYYKNGIVYGTVDYDKDVTIERMAFRSPDPTNADTSEIENYKAAGFTLLNTEGVAALKDDAMNTTAQADLVQYLEAAHKHGLGVIVFAEPINYMLTSEAAIDTLYGGIWKELLDLYVDFLDDYPAFRGFMMSDELNIRNIDNYTAVVTYLKENHPNVYLQSSQLPIYAYEGDPTLLMPGADENTGAEVAYKYYAEAFGTVSGHYNYNLYSLRNKYYLVDGWKDIVEDEWYDSLKYVSEVASEKEFTTGITIQATYIPGGNGTYNHYAPTKEEDIGFQMYTAMAYGMQEINFYKWGKHDTIPDETDYISANEQVRAAVTNANTDLNAFASVFKAFTWKQTLDIASGSTNSATGNTRLSSVTSSAARAFVGCMKHEDGFDGYMIANADGPREAAQTSVTLTFNDATTALIYYNGVLTEVSLTDGKCNVTLNAGEGAFVIPR